jgi:hypothetical protein
MYLEARLAKYVFVTYLHVYLTNIIVMQCVCHQFSH